MVPLLQLFAAVGGTNRVLGKLVFVVRLRLRKFLPSLHVTIFSAPELTKATDSVCDCRDLGVAIGDSQYTLSVGGILVRIKTRVLGFGTVRERRWGAYAREILWTCALRTAWSCSRTEGRRDTEHGCCPTWAQLSYLRANPILEPILPIQLAYSCLDRKISASIYFPCPTTTNLLLTPKRGMSQEGEHGKASKSAIGTSCGQEASQKRRCEARSTINPSDLHNLPEQRISDHRTMFELAIQQSGGLEMHETKSLPNQ